MGARLSCTRLGTQQERGPCDYSMDAHLKFMHKHNLKVRLVWGCAALHGGSGGVGGGVGGGGMVQPLWKIAASWSLAA